MRLESRSVRQVNGMRRDVIDRGKIVEPQRRKIWPSAIWSERRKCHTRWQQVRELLQRRSAIRGSLRPGEAWEEARQQQPTMARVGRIGQSASQRPAFRRAGLWPVET